MNRRMLLVLAGWTVAAVLAVAVGVAAISVIGAGLTTAASAPLTEADVARKLRALPPAPPSTAPALSPSPSLGPAATASLGAASTRTLPTRAGTVVARCAEGEAEIVTMSPRDGFTLHDQDDDEGEFRSSTDGDDRVRFDVVCTGGQPSLVLDATGDED